MSEYERFEELRKALDHLHVNATQVTVAAEASNLLGSALTELAACRKALEPFARMFRWTNLPSTDDEAQVLCKKHWLTGAKIKLTTDHFRLAALAFYHGGVSPYMRDGGEELAEAMGQEMERYRRDKAMQAALDEFEKGERVE